MRIIVEALNVFVEVVSLISETMRVTVEAMRVLLEAMNVFIEAVSVIIEAEREIFNKTFKNHFLSKYLKSTVYCDPDPLTSHESVQGGYTFDRFLREGKVF
jgi:hypothetical protein